MYSLFLNFIRRSHLIVGLNMSSSWFTMPKKILPLLSVLMLVGAGLSRSTVSAGLGPLSGFVQDRSANESHIAPDKIIGGRPTGIGAYPWVVHLNVAGVTCGGSLLSYRHVITAAHCVVLEYSYRYEDVIVYLAEYDTRTTTDCDGGGCVQTVAVHPESIIYHSQYQPQVFHNDIAMLTLSGYAPNTDYISPILLPTFNINEPNYDGTPLTITGWGQTEYSQASPLKLHAQVQLVSPYTCSRYAHVTPGVLCAASRNGQDTCYGDSGGPLMLALKGHYYLVGIVSSRISRCGSSVPSMYTNVYYYLDWIQYYMRY